MAVGVDWQCLCFVRSPRATRTRCWRGEIEMRCADLRREVAAVIAAKPASALLYDTAVWYARGMVVWACGCVFCGGMRDAMGSKTFSIEQIRPTSLIQLDMSAGLLIRKSLSRKALFRLCKKPGLISS